jgi:uncharacterized protein with FMN-binding domain
MTSRNFIITSMAAVAVAVLISAVPDSAVLSKEGSNTVVNTTLLTKNVRGFKGATPLKITIRKNRVVKIEALKNHESPQYFAKAKTLLSKYEGKTVTKAQKMNVDAVSGATFSSKALIKNVKEGLTYYKQHK